MRLKSINDWFAFLLTKHKKRKMRDVACNDYHNSQTQPTSSLTRRRPAWWSMTYFSVSDILFNAQVFLFCFIMRTSFAETVDLNSALSASRTITSNCRTFIIGKLLLLTCWQLRKFYFFCSLHFVNKEILIKKTNRCSMKHAFISVRVIWTFKI